MSFKRKLSNFFRIKESDKHFLLALLAVIGVVFFWRGAWMVMDITPIVENPFVSIAIGLAIMTFSGVIYREFLPQEEPLTPLIDIINEAFKHPEKKRKLYIIKYYDALRNEHRELPHSKIQRIEHNFLVTERNGEEHFIPIHRIREIHAEGKIIWKHKFSK